MSEARKELPKRAEAKLPDILNEKGVHKVEKYGWPFFKAGVIATLGEKFLLIKEAKVKQLVDGQEQWLPSTNGKWNLPCGRLQQWESFEQAAAREGSEESGYDFDLGCIRHIGFRADINNPYIIVIYHAENPFDISFSNPPDSEEIAGIGWFSYEEILQLKADRQLRNPELVMAAVENELAGVVIPEEAIAIYDSKFSD